MPDTSKEVAEQRAMSETSALNDWFNTYGEHGELRVQLKRMRPAKAKTTSGKWVDCKGLVCTYDEPITEQEVQSEHGGGKYQIQVETRSKSKLGNPIWVYAGARTFEIAGKPRVDHLEDNEDDDDSSNNNGNNGHYEGGSTVNAVLGMAKDLVEDSRRQAQQGGMDAATLAALMDPLRAQLGALQTALSDKDNKLFDIATRKPDTSGQDKLFDIMQNKEAEHGNHLSSIRTQHDSELRQLREFNREELKSKSKANEDDIRRLERQHEREVETFKFSMGQAIETQKNSYEMRISGMNDTIANLRQQLSESRTELVALRAKKEMSPADQIASLVTLKSGFDALMPSSDEPEQSTIEKIISHVSPVAEAAIARFGSRPAPMQPQEPMVPFQRPDGSTVMVPQRYLMQRQAEQQAAAAAQAQGAAAQPGEPAPIKLDPADVKRAVSFMESAVGNGTDPETFARSARNMVPEALLFYLKQQGVDAFLNNVAQLETSSPLATVAGRVWVRQVAKYLLEGTTEGVEPDEEPFEEEPASP